MVFLFVISTMSCSAQRRMAMMEGTLTVVAVAFFGSFIWYMQPQSREALHSTTVVHQIAPTTESGSWTRSPADTYPKSYRLVHLRCVFTDTPADSTHEHHIRNGRIPVLFVHGNAGSYDLASSLASLLPLGKWPPLSRKPLEDAPVPALGMTVFSADMNEDANIHSGSILVKQASFIRKSLAFLKRRFLSYYHTSSTNGTKACGVAYENAKKDFEAQLSPLDAKPGDFCSEMLAEVDSVRTHGLWLVGHSMGGIVVKVAAVMANLAAERHPRLQRLGPLIAGIISVNTPHRYPPIFIDSTMWDVYAALHQTWDYASRAADGERHILWGRVLQENVTSSTLDSLPPVVSFHGGPLDEQVFFETTLVGFRPALLPKDSTRNATDSRSLSTNQLLDCGFHFDHNTLLWSVEFVEPLVEMLWRIHARLVNTTDRNAPKFALRSSLLSVSDVWPPRRVCSDVEVSVQILVENHLGTTQHSYQRRWYIIAPVRLSEAKCLTVTGLLNDGVATVLSIAGGIQFPMLRKLLNGDVESWSLLFVDALPETADLRGAVIHVGQSNWVRPLFLQNRSTDKGLRGLVSRVSTHGVLRGLTDAQRVTVQRGDAYWVQQEEISGVVPFCALLPRSAIHEKGDLDSNLRRPSTADAITFLRLSEHRTLWRPYRDDTYFVVCSANVSVTHIRDPRLIWVHSLVVNEAGPFVMWMSCFVVVVVVLTKIATPRAFHLTAIIVTLTLTLAHATVTQPQLSAASILTAVCAGGGLGLTFCKVVNVAADVFHDVGTALLHGHSTVRFCVQGCSLLATLVVPVMLWPGCFFVSASFFASKDLRNVLATGSLLAFHATGCVMFVRNWMLGSFFEDIAPEHLFSMLLMCCAHLFCWIINADVECIARLRTRQVATLCALAAFEYSKYVPHVDFKTEQSIGHNSYWDCSLCLAVMSMIASHIAAEGRVGNRC